MPYRNFLPAILSICLASQAVAAEKPASVRRDPGSGLSFRLTGTHGPVIVFESATAEPMTSWDAVVAELASCGRRLTYDRLGSGRSARLHTPRVLAGDVAARLRRLLRDLGLSSSVILVGHSIGGLYVQAFARRFPHRVAGVVLVDATSPLEPAGVFVPTVPPARGTTAAAEEAGAAKSMETLRHAPAFPPVPLVVLAATKHDDTPEREALWQQVQERTAASSPRGTRIVVESGHFIPRERPMEVVKAIRSMACRP